MAFFKNYPYFIALLSSELYLKFLVSLPDSARNSQWEVPYKLIHRITVQEYNLEIIYGNLN